MCMWFSAIFSNIISWIFDPKNRIIILFIGIAIFIMLFLKQCNDISSLKNQLVAKQTEIQRVQNNSAASLDTIRQSYDSKTGTLTATIQGYDLTVKELNSKYANLFDNVSSLKTTLKGFSPTSISTNTFESKERITDISSSAYALDSMGESNIKFKADTNFIDGNFRKISGKIPFRVAFYKKQDSSLISYEKQNFYSRVYAVSGSIINIDQQMTVYTGLDKNDKTGEVSVWAKTKYPGVTFNILKGATIEDDNKTKSILEESKKTWGLGFSFGIGAICEPQQKIIFPGIYMGIGINYTPKKLQWGK